MPDTNENLTNIFSGGMPPVQIPRQMYVCGECGERVPEGTLTELGRSTYCSSCWENALSNGDIFLCEGCDTYYHDTEYSHDGYCSGCGENDEEEERENQTPPSPEVSPKSITSHMKGKIIKSSRHFGIELETIAPKDGILICPSWMRKSDGSIHPPTGYYGIEIVSPILGGKKGEESVATMTATLREQGVLFNNSCSYHLHLDAREYYAEESAEMEAAQKNLDDFCENEAEKYYQRMQGTLTNEEKKDSWSFTQNTMRESRKTALALLVTGANIINDTHRTLLNGASFLK